MAKVTSHLKVCLPLLIVSNRGLLRFHLVGSLLKVPQYIINMTNLRTQEDMMQAMSLAPESDVSFVLNQY